MIQDLAIILIVAGIVTLLFKKLKQPVVLGYIVAGFLISDKMPYMPAVDDQNYSVEDWAEIGVMFLMFCLGLEFSVKKILKQGLAPVKAALITIAAMVTLGICVGILFGWSDMNCLFLGGMLAMSSTTIIYKAFDDLQLHQYKFSSMVMSVLILEDIFGIVMMVILQTIAGGANEDGSIINSLLGILAFLVISFASGLILIPVLFKKIRHLASAETLLIVSLGLCCTMAIISAKCGFSTALGAFLIGSVMSETSEVEKINKIVEPVKNLFGAVFFVSVGMLVDPAILVDHALPIIVLVLAIIFGQAVFGTLGYFISGESLKSAMRCGFSMAQIGEFSFIIATVGLSLGVISDFIYPVVVTVSVITTFLTPYMIRAAEPAYRGLEKLLSERILNWANNRSSDNRLKHNKYAEAFVNAIKNRINNFVNSFYLQTKINAGNLPQNSLKLMNRDIHISEFTIPEDSRWMGRTLMEMQLGTIFNVHISSILRGSRRINIPLASEILLPGDRLQVIGGDEDMAIFSKAINGAVFENDDSKQEEEMTLKKIVITEGSLFFEKNLIQLNLRERYKAMVVGMERGEKKLSVISPDYKFQSGDIIWIVAEATSIKSFV